MLWMYQLTGLLAQVPPPIPADDSDHTAPVKRAMSFSDLQQGLRADNNGEATSFYFKYGLIAMVVVIIILAILLNLRQRKKEGQAPDSEKKLAKELTKKIPLPFGARMVLGWAARSADVPVAMLLISTTAFDDAAREWTNKPTFALLRRWGKVRLDQLRPVLFD